MIIGIPVYEGVDLLDVTAPHEVLSWIVPKVELRLIGKTANATITARDGFRFLTSHGFDDPAHLDVIWVPGGDPRALAKLMRGQPDRTYLDFLIDRAASATWVCSVCEGALLLAAAGLLRGHRATTHWNFYPCLKSFDGVTVVSGFPRFVRDGKLLTGGGISSGIDEALELVRLLTNDDVAQDIQSTLQYYPQPRFPDDLKEPSGCEFPGLSQHDLTPA